MNVPTHQSRASASPSFRTLWQAEAIRLRETHWGPLEDTAELRRAGRPGLDLSGRIALRAELLATRDGLAAHLAHWRQGARLAAVVLLIIAALAGAGAAWGALGSGQQPVNLARALLALLGLHAVTFLLWLLSCWPGAAPASGLSQAWLWLTRKLVRGPDAALASQALTGLLARARAWRATLGGISHSAWTVAFISALLALLLLLSTRRYTFQWETTLLSPESFVALAHAVGAWPSLLGFPIPDSGIVQASDGLHALPAIAQADWSIWLIGCVVAWGLLPRLIAGLLCLAVARRRLRRLTIDPGLPGWLELRERLMPRHRPAGIDAPAPTPDSVNARAAPRAGPGTGPMALLGMELAPDTPWPPPGTPSDVRDLGVCDSRSDRRRVVQDIQPPPERLLVVYDARQTPDRGTRAWLAELRQICPHTDALLLNRPAREAMWREAFDAQGIALVPSLADWARRDTP